MNSIVEQISWWVAICGAISALVHWFTKSHYSRLLAGAEKEKTSLLRDISGLQVSLQNSSLHLEAMQRSRQTTVASLRSLQNLLQVVGQILKTDSASVLIPHPRHPSLLVFLAAIGPAKDKIIMLHIPIKESQAGTAFTQNQAISWSNSSTAIQDSTADQKSGFSTHSMLSIPLHNSASKAIAVVQIVSSDNRNVFQIDDAKQLHPYLLEMASCVSEIVRDHQFVKLLPFQQVGADRQVVSLCADITDFGSLFNLASICDIAGFLNDLFMRFSNIVRENGGEVGGYPGDGFFACFADEQELERTKSALCSAERIRWEFGECANDWAKLGIPAESLGLRIGLASGSCCYCLLGHPQDAVPTFIGPAVNRSFQMCEYARYVEDKIAICSAMAQSFQVAVPNFILLEHNVEGVSFLSFSEN